jgi:uncharacterized protein (TIGR02996 family)
MAPPLPDEQAALLAAVVAEPDDDTPRLVYADWLQENGDEEQARFIRESIACARLADHEDDARERIAKRLDDVAARNGPRWLAEVGVVGGEPEYDRGMAEGVIYASFDAFRADAPLLFARVPVRDLTLRSMGWCEDQEDTLPALAAMPEIARLRALRLSNDFFEVSPDNWERFVASPHLARVRELAVSDALLEDSDATAFAAAGPFPLLERLDLSGNRITAAGALALVRSGNLPRLERLGLAGNDIKVDRRRGSLYLALRAALVARFGDLSALDVRLG